MTGINVILISSVRPEQTTAASIILHRHLVNQPGISTTILPAEDDEITRGSFRSRIISRLNRTRFSRWAIDAGLVLHSIFPIGRSLPPPTTPANNTLVLAFAAYNGCWVAWRYASQHKLPLAVRFDDWWPDSANVHSWMRGYLNNKFTALHRASSVSICISEGMKKNLGSHPNVHVILPIPEAGRMAAPARKQENGVFKVCYLGNMYDYGPMLAGLAQQAMNQSKIRIEFRGPEPRWPEELKQQMRSKGLLHSFGTGVDFECWFESFDAYLVAMFFEPEHRRRVETCFASKLTEYSALGRPIVVWAPETSSVIRWARQTGAALCVTDPSPESVIKALLSLAEDTQRQTALGTAARHAYETDFNPGILQQQFVNALSSVL